MKRFKSRPAVITYAFVIISAVCLSSAVVPSKGSVADACAAGQRAGCEAAVKRIQKAVTEEAYAYVATRRAGCQFASLPVDSRAGKPQAIYKLTQQKLEEARQEVAAAYRAAGDCSISGIEKPEIFETAEDSAASYLICLERGRKSCSGLQPEAFNDCEFENNRRREAREDTCEHLIEKLDCEGLHVVEKNKTPKMEEEEVVTVPNDMEPECREAYLQLKAAEKELKRAEAYLNDITPKFSGAGPRGYEMYKRAQANRDSAWEKKNQAEKNLKDCQGISEGDEKEPIAGGENWAGTWAGSYNHVVTISGGGDSISASFQYQQVGASGSGQWSNCRVTGNTLECDYTAHHDDATKSGSRSGKVKVSLSGDTITGTFYEDTPQWSYKPGYSAANVNSAMFKGAEFHVTFKRQ
jgi:hypothetical protein